MKKLHIAVASTLLVLLASQAASAADLVFFKAPVSVAGTGCSPGSISVVGENTATLSVLFAAYDAGAHAVSGLPRSACSFAVPVKVPQGFQVSVMTADWQGYAKGSGTLQRKYFLAGQPAQPWLTNNYGTASGTNFMANDGLMHATATTGCAGGEFNLRINSNIKANTPSSYIAVDTLDLQNKVVFHLKWAPCH